MNKKLIVSFLLLIGGFLYLKAEQGDFATLGYNTPSGYSYWRVNSSGNFVPGVASTLDIGSSALPISTIYAGAATLTGTQTISGNITHTGSKITTTGNVGINTTNPLSNLEVKSDISDATGYIVKISSQDSTGILWIKSDGTMYFGDINQVSTFTAGAWNITGAITSLGALAGTTLDTGQGAGELYGMNQYVNTISSPTFGGAVFNGIGSKVAIGRTNATSALDISSGTITIAGTGAPLGGYALCLSSAGAMGHCGNQPDSSGVCSCSVP